MEAYRIYFVTTARVKPGNRGAAAQWWKEKGAPFFAKLPGVKSMQTYATQFDLGSGEYSLETWYEVDNYAVLDAWDEAIIAEPEKYSTILQEYNDLFESGPSRLVGDWPESMLSERD